MLIEQYIKKYSLRNLERSWELQTPFFSREVSPHMMTRVFIFFR